MANWFPQNSADFLLKDVYYQENFDYLSITKDKSLLRLSADFDISKKDSKFTLGYRKTDFWRRKKLKMSGIKKIDIYSSDNEDNILLQLNIWVVNEEKYKTLMKTNDDIEEIFKPFLIQHNKNERSFLIGFYKKTPRLNEIQLIIDKAHIMGKMSRSMTCYCLYDF